MTSAAMIKSVHFPCRIGKFCNPKGLFSKTAGFGSVVSRIESYKLWDRTLYIKHDHELFISGLHGDVCGNKIRKFKSLIEMDLPPRTIISCGGSQSNAMRALAAISHGKKARFIYLTRPIAKSLRLEPRGNLAAALKSGMEVCMHNNNCQTILIASLITVGGTSFAKQPIFHLFSG
jgi:1-aminocyclopropane-1-carboxylate deaminase/D-cysteine desulfhydrase-like pyridoxal-dependent ACC family enzyme